MKKIKPADYGKIMDEIVAKGVGIILPNQIAFDLGRLDGGLQMR